MLDIKRYKKLFGIVVVLVLLSFFDTARESVVTDTVPVALQEENHGEIMCLAADEVEEDIDRVLPAKTQIDEFVAREPEAMHDASMRFVAVVSVLLCMMQFCCRVIIRYFGSRMIALWENIIYIHQIDGKKGRALLYT